MPVSRHYMQLLPVWKQCFYVSSVRNSRTALFNFSPKREKKSCVNPLTLGADALLLSGKRTQFNPHASFNFFGIWERKDGQAPANGVQKMFQFFAFVPRARPGGMRKASVSTELSHGKTGLGWWPLCPCNFESCHRRSMSPGLSTSDRSGCFYTPPRNSSLRKSAS